MAALRNALPLLLAIPILSSCAPGPLPDPTAGHLLTGTRTPIPLGQLRAATDLAHRFASAYASSIYRRDSPRLPGATPDLSVALRAAAARIPPERIGHRPHAAGLRLEPLSPWRLRAAITIADPNAPSFSVGFELERRPGGWRVTSISPPG